MAVDIEGWCWINVILAAAGLIGVLNEGGGWVALGLILVLNAGAIVEIRLASWRRDKNPRC